MKIIKLDVDNEKKEDAIMKVKERMWVLAYLRLSVENIQVMETTHGLHVRIWINNELNHMATVALQAILGSDHGRECFNFDRVTRKKKRWNVLFREKYENGKLVSKEKSNMKYAQILRNEYKKQKNKESKQ